jgi:hypothetical protein
MRGPLVGIEQQFVEALSASQAGDNDAELLPVHLTRAVASTLAVDGAGLSIHGQAQKRTPLGASSNDAATAERLQFTAGAGPCLEAARSGWPVFAVETLLHERWPAFHEMLLTRTPFRIVIALPLRGELRGIGALDLYLTNPLGLAALDAFDAHATATTVSDLLEHAAAWSAWTEEEGPAWMNSPAARRRSQVWLAMGMVSEALKLPISDALAVLRSVAYASDRVVDDVARDITSGRLDPQQLREDAESDH